MSTVADVIDKIRVELEDAEDARWTDAKLVVLVQKSVDRLNKVLMKNSVKEAKKDYDFTTIIGTDTYSVPTDYMAMDSLYRVRRDDKTGWAQAVDFRNDDQWERMISATECTNWRVWADNIEIFDVPQSEIELRFYYWPQIDFTDWATTSTMPWDGKFDEVVAEYVTLRCKNIDEKNLSWDMRLLAEIADQWIDTFGTANPASTTTDGFFPDSNSWYN